MPIFLLYANDKFSIARGVENILEDDSIFTTQLKSFEVENCTEQLHNFALTGETGYAIRRHGNHESLNAGFIDFEINFLNREKFYMHIPGSYNIRIGGIRPSVMLVIYTFDKSVNISSKSLVRIKSYFNGVNFTEIDKDIDEAIKPDEYFDIYAKYMNHECID
jgi:hypothetical protein